MKKKIITIGGGHGQSALLAGMRDFKNIELKAIVSMFDSGGRSTSRLIKEFNILPPGDIVHCTLALAPEREKIESLFKYRFERGEKLINHSLGNLLMLVLGQFSQDYIETVNALREALHVKNEVLPVTITPADIEAILEDGTKVFGEANIDVPSGKRAPIKSMRVVAKKGKVKAYPPTVKAIQEADYLILTFGDFYTSLIPNLLVSEVQRACQNFKGKIIYIVNSCTKLGETDNYTAKDFVLNLEKYLERKVDYVILNSSRRRTKDSSLAVPLIKEKKWDNRVIIKGDYSDTKADRLFYDGHKVAKVIKRIINL